MVYDGKSYVVSTVQMLNKHGIERKEYVRFRKLYPSLTIKEIIDLILSKRS